VQGAGTIPKDFDILMVNDAAYIDGGASQIALSSAVALAERGYRVILFSAVPPVMPELESDNLQVFCTRQYDILHDPNRFRAVCQGIWNFYAARLFKNLLASLDPARTIIHVHSYVKALSASVLKEAIKQRYNIIVTLHDYFWACPNGGFYNYQENTVCKLIPLSNDCIKENCDSRNYAHKIWRVARSLVYQKMGSLQNGFKHFITISEFSKNILRPFLPENCTIYHVPNPIVIDKSDPIAVDENEAFIFLGRFSREKGVHLLAQAAANLGCQALFIGDGHLRATIHEVNKSAEITGWLPKSEVLQILYKARALVFPSLWYETFGLAVGEALACGVPVIVSDACAARELVDHGKTGLCFKSGSTDDLAEKMQMLLKPGLAKKMGREAYNRYWANPFSVDKHIADLLKVYHGLI
jgi:glycosyltransferase involved in cell wall biosynthesis